MLFGSTSLVTTFSFIQRKLVTNFSISGWYSFQSNRVVITSEIYLYTFYSFEVARVDAKVKKEK